MNFPLTEAFIAFHKAFQFFPEFFVAAAFRIVFHIHIKPDGTVLQTDFGQLRIVEMAHGRMKHRRHRNVLKRIIQYPEHV